MSRSHIERNPPCTYAVGVEVRYSCSDGSIVARDVFGAREGLGMKAPGQDGHQGHCVHFFHMGKFTCNSISMLFISQAQFVKLCHFIYVFY
jgi:hypothetical protein